MAWCNYNLGCGLALAHNEELAIDAVQAGILLSAER
jgi:hypothetical protein